MDQEAVIQLLNSYNVSSPFGERTIGGRKELHRGVDFSIPIGTPLYAIVDGYVKRKGYQENGAGYYIVIGDKGTPNTYGSYETKYFHMKGPSMLDIGDKVSAGQLIGYSGTSGNSTGPHLHLERWEDDTAVDSLQWVNSLLKSDNHYPEGTPQWKIEAVEWLYDQKLITDETWRKKINEPIPLWAIATILKRMKG